LKLFLYEPLDIDYPDRSYKSIRFNHNSYMPKFLESQLKPISRQVTPIWQSENFDRSLGTLLLLVQLSPFSSNTTSLIRPDFRCIEIVMYF